MDYFVILNKEYKNKIFNGLADWIIDRDKNVLMSSSETGYTAIEDEALRLVLNEERPLKIINAFENKSAAILKLPKYINTYVYVVKYLEEDISKYLTESQEAINFYYTVEEKSTGIKISFAIIFCIQYHCSC